MVEALERKDTAFLFALLKLAEIGAHKSLVRVPTEKFGELLGLSQQSASRILRLLERRGFIERFVSKDGTYARITNGGIERLSELHRTLVRIFESRIEPIAFKGIVFSGLGEGSYYVKLYRRVLRDKIGFDPFPGTLNLRAVAIEDLKALERIRSLPALEIKAFKDRGRSLGSARCYRVLIENRLRGVLIVPERTHYGKDVAEILAAEKLREKLGLKDGDIVTIEVTFEGNPFEGWDRKINLC